VGPKAEGAISRLRHQPLSSPALAAGRVVRWRPVAAQEREADGDQAAVGRQWGREERPALPGRRTDVLAALPGEAERFPANEPQPDQPQPPDQHQRQSQACGLLVVCWGCTGRQASQCGHALAASG
jgi:hypothetical protein